MCEVKLERALNSRKLETLRQAIDMPRKLGVSLAVRQPTGSAPMLSDSSVKTIKLIKTYQQHAKNLMSDILNESYVTAQLQDAISAMNIDLLKSAIKLAEDSKMPYLKEIAFARQTLEDQYQTRTILGILQTELAVCSSVPKLLARVDTINPLLHQALTLGLAGEYVVKNCVTRVNKIQSLIQLRNDMRTALELCSSTRMEM